MTKKQKQALKTLQHRVIEVFGEAPVTIADVTAIAKQELRYNVCRMAAIFELRKEDFWRFYDKNFTPPYFVSAFRRYFNIKQEAANA